MTSRFTSIVIAGVGGQGSILMADIIGKAAINAGLDVKGMNTYGAAQRGGPVLSQLRIGERVFSPLVGLREAEAIVALEPSEALRVVNFLKKGGKVLVNTERIDPIEVISGLTKYPDLDTVLSPLKALSGTFIGFNATRMAESAGGLITLNVVMLGALTACGILPFSEGRVTRVLEEEVPRAVLPMNLKAFRLGFDFVKQNIREIAKYK